MSTILIMHPEGNLNGNPNLSGLVVKMAECGWGIQVISRKNESACQAFTRDKVVFSLLDSFDVSCINKLVLNKWMFFQKMKEKPSLIIGIDEGIIEAAYYATKFNVPLGYISYEIKFSGEISAEFKSKEIIASRTLDFVVVQDKTRERELFRENNIDKIQSFLIPVAGVRVEKSCRKKYIHEKYGIDPNKKIALSIGSLCDWSCTAELLDSVNHWPDDWILFLHSRSRNDDYLAKYVSSKGLLNSKVIISKESVDNIDDIEPIITSSDLGVVFYRATFSDYSCGNNIKYSGMSSGKAATYLKYGLPLAVFGNDYYEEFVTNYQIGINVADPSKFMPVKLDEGVYSRCSDFFDIFLDLNVTSAELLRFIERYRANT